MRLHFLGANRQVTGSRSVLEAGGRRHMIDCGLFQERECLSRNWDPPPLDPASIDTLLLTHAHLDHCGRIPKLVKEGFRGPILATHPTIDLARIVLRDSAEIQEEDAAYKRRRHRREGRRGPHPEVPLYTVEEAEASFDLFRPVTYERAVELGGGTRVEYLDAGHILGSAMLRLTVETPRGPRRLLLSGDLGTVDRPLMHDPTLLDEADVVVMESTYGDREHDSDADLLDQLAEVVNDTVERGGNVVIPTFAIDRAQALLFRFSELVHAGRIPRLTIFLDSPMAVDVTTLYKRYRHMLDEETQAMLQRGHHPFQFPGLHLVRSRDESRSINSIRGSCIVMAGSGMCTGGRVKHHLRRNIDRAESTVLFVGYQAHGTLGRHILEGDEEVRIHGRHYAVRARIAQLQGLSAHADRAGLLRWLGHLKRPPRRVFLVHGEADAAASLAERITADLGWPVHVPEYEEVVELDL